MTESGNVERIQIAPAQGSLMQTVDEIEAVAQQGLRGDRYFVGEGTFANRNGCDVTFIEAETLTAVKRDYGIDLEPGVHRRNITTHDIAINHLVGKRFHAGEAVCKGIELCEPCPYLEQHLEEEGLRESLIHRGGLRAAILENGLVSVGDDITPVE